jgi:homoprotocatechuate degradation regulator HpaR
MRYIVVAMVNDESHLQSLPVLLARARAAVAGRFRKVLRQHGMTVEQWRILLALTTGDFIEARRLAQRTDLLQPSLSRILKDLQRRDLLLRVPDRLDARRVLVIITPAGRQLVNDTKGDTREVFAEINALFGKKETEALRKELVRLVEVLGSAAEEGVVMGEMGSER